ncbi:MAG: MBL fold metallo-hydrolase [Alistipes sp.]|nr:MBL fold metallo-hydrolase [Candidatus Alistipes equi]
MKKLLLILIMLLLALQSEAYDWKAQTNEELHKDMITFTRGFKKRVKNTIDEQTLKALLKEQKEFSSDRYAWIRQTVDAVLEMERRHLPVEDVNSNEALLRRDMLLLLDFPLHADNRSKDAPIELKNAFSSVSNYYRKQGRERALMELKKDVKLQNGELQVIKIYNCGIILRTVNHTIAIDVKWEGDEAGALEIASKIDAFFLSHPHKDHYSDVMIKALKENKVPTVLPKNVVANTMWDEKHIIYEDKYSPIDINGIKTIIQTGLQRDIPNNAYILEMDGWRILLPGESGKYKRLYELSSMEAPDLILVPSWNKANRVFEAVRMMKNYKASRVFCIPEHENELTHTVNHRESYRELFTREDRLGNFETIYPRIVLLDIGESYTLKK